MKRYLNGVLEDMPEDVKLAREAEIQATQSRKSDPYQIILNTSQFEWLLAFSGLEEARDSILTSVKGNKDLYATLRASLNKKRFHFAIVLEMLALIQTTGFALPLGYDFSEKALSALWLQAKDI